MVTIEQARSLAKQQGLQFFPKVSTYLYLLHYWHPLCLRFSFQGISLARHSFVDREMKTLNSIFIQRYQIFYQITDAVFGNISCVIEREIHTVCLIYTWDFCIPLNCFICRKRYKCAPASCFYSFTCSFIHFYLLA